ncbi:hypothetical protein ACP70R_014601 [Stipagrostis hirtigluma subsp. patula]
MSPPARPPPALLDELVEEVLLRFPPEEPASLVRAALVCKRWCRLVCGRRFRRRFREFHRTPPLLGVLCNVRPEHEGSDMVRFGSAYEGSHMAHFVPAFSCCPPCADHRNRCALDARHGRVLLLNTPVLCAATGPCDHVDCPFLVIHVGSDSDSKDLSVCVYSSEAGSWNKLTYVVEENQFCMRPAALVGNALYFLMYSGGSILEYDLATQDVSVIEKPQETYGETTVLITTEDGGLGLAVASAEGSEVTLWSMEAMTEGCLDWAPTRVIDLVKLIPGGAFGSIFPELVGFAHGVGALFVWTNGGLFSIDLKSDQAI